MSDDKKKSGKSKKKATRASSNVFAFFDQNQIQEFKEAFTMIDQDRDGFISAKDLKDTFGSLGREISDKDLDEMIKEAPGPINFTMLLTLFGERLNGTDPEDVILTAFKLLDPDNTGSIPAKELKTMLGKRGERLNEEEIDQMMDGAPVDGKGQFDYEAFTKIVKRGKEDDA